MASSKPFNLKQLHPWDFDSNGLYCITITTKNRQLLLGTLSNNQMNWSVAGGIVDLLWRQLPKWSKGVSIGEFVVMPNHLHGIICVDRPLGSTVLHATQLRGFYAKNEEMSHISPAAGSVSSIIRSYKAAVTKQLHLLDLEFAWERSFHSYSIPTAQAYQKVLQHIQHNYQNWKTDKLHPYYQTPKRTHHLR